MKQNILQNVIGFVLKYIWVFCGLLVVLELGSVAYTTSILMQQSACGAMQSVSGDISSRVDGVLRLLTEMASDERFSDISKPLYDRAIQALPYQESYGLFMIALTDADVNVISADEKEPPTKNFSLAYRDYMQRLYATGKYQITDAFLSGDGHDIMNYTIAVPIMAEGKVEGSVFGSIYFNDIEQILTERSQNRGQDFYLLGMENTVMAGNERKVNSKSFLELSEGSYFFGQDAESINRSIQAGKSDDFWEFDKDGLFYVTYERVLPANWTIVYRVNFLSVFAKLIPVLCFKICFYILMCIAVHVLGRKYLNRHLAQVNHLLNRMAVMQKELFQSEQPDYDHLIMLTQQGLTDQLTGLSTRAVLLKKMMKIQESDHFYGAVIFIDLDDLKRINDNFGHEGGDCALSHFAKILKQYEQEYQGIAARYGGDEFILVLTAIRQEPASAIIHKLCVDLNTQITTENHTFSIHGSLGVSMYPKDGTEMEDLICKADLALYAAKQQGKNRCAFFDNGHAML